MWEKPPGRFSVLGDVPHFECVGNPEEKFSSYDLNARWQWLVVSY